MKASLQRKTGSPSLPRLLLGTDRVQKHKLKVLCTCPLKGHRPHGLSFWKSSTPIVGVTFPFLISCFITFFLFRFLNFSFKRITISPECMYGHHVHAKPLRPEQDVRHPRTVVVSVVSAETEPRFSTRATRASHCRAVSLAPPFLCLCLVLFLFISISKYVFLIQFFALGHRAWDPVPRECTPDILAFLLLL